MSADDDVIKAHDCRERAHSQNDGKGCKPGRDKGKPENVSFARTPIAIQQCRGAFPVNIARTMHARTGVENNIFYQLRHPCCLSLSIGRAFTGKSFSEWGRLEGANRLLRSESNFDPCA